MLNILEATRYMLNIKRQSLLVTRCILEIKPFFDQDVNYVLSSLMQLFLYIVFKKNTFTTNYQKY